MTNEFFFILSTLIVMAFMLIAFRLGKIYVISLIAVCLVLSNIIGPKIVLIFGFAITAGTPIFAALPLGTDLLAEKYGPKVARQAVLCAFIAMALFILLSRPLQLIDTAPFALDAGGAVDSILSESLRLMIASPVAYFVWQMIDVAIFKKIKDKTGENYLWIRNNVSTFVAQAGSTLTFFALAFAGTPVPWFEIALVTIAFYWIIALFDTAIVYLARKIEPLEFKF